MSSSSLVPARGLSLKAAGTTSLLLVLSLTSIAAATSCAGGDGGRSTGGTGGHLATGGAGTQATGGSVSTGGQGGTGGLPPGTGGNQSTGGANASGGAGTGGATSLGGGGMGGSSLGGRGGGGGQPMGGAPASTGGAGGAAVCVASKAANASVTGSGPHKVTVETNAGTGIQEGTIYRPSDLGGAEKYPLFVWGNGACSRDGLSNTAAMGEIASHGYFVIADGTPGGSGGRTQTSDWVSMGKPLLAYITWAIAENAKPCSAYFGALDTTKIASNGFSCGGLMSEGAAGDPRITTFGVTSSGLTSADMAYSKTLHTPVLIVLGGTSDIAYQNGERDYTTLTDLGLPVMLFSKNIGHGGDLLGARGGDFTKLGLAWLNWRLKGDESAAGKGLLMGTGCSYCRDSAWEVKSKNIP